MYRLLIVDDEPIIVDWIYELFMEMKELDLDIYRAYSAFEALEWLNRAKIDIVLADIKMPGMNGLELLEAIHRNWPKCKVIFLTAFNDFDYIYTAIKYQGVSYILKTEGDDKIVEEVKKAINEVEKSVKLDNIISRANEQRKVMIPLLQKEFALELLHNKNINKDEMQLQLNNMDIPLKQQSSNILLIGRLDNWFKNISSAAKTNKVYIAQAIVEDFLKSHINSFFVYAEDEILVWIIQPKKPESEDSWNRILLFIRGTIESIQKACLDSIDESISFAISKKSFEWDNISTEYNSLKMLINDISYYGQGVVITEDKLINFDKTLPKNQNQQVFNEINKIQKLKIFLESGQKKEFFKIFNEIEENINSFQNLKYSMTLQVYYSIALMLLSYINERIDIKEFISNIDLSKLMKMNKHSRHEIFDYFREFALNIFDNLDNEQNDRNKIIVSKIQSYINDNLNKDLSLVKIAEIVYLNPIYLSRLYKQITNTNLSDYINKIRFKRAEILLKETNLKIHEIAAEVGYESTSYFIRQFKKSTNITPQEFRESLE